MSRYIAFDVETPNRWNSRMSAIGIAVVEGEQVVKTFYSLVNPEQPFDYFNTMLTGIDEEMVAAAPTFPELWPTIEPILSSGILVAHNASFDMTVLKKCLQAYGIPWQNRVQGICTVLMGRRLLPHISHKLNDLCAYYGIDLNHHRADSDSLACAQILLRYLASGADPAPHIRSYNMI
ncbi:MAG: 3'-5' exonuclease [Clostridia bacterium]|nr:3'-5' exonuclease [Clostridia bacterium]